MLFKTALGHSIRGVRMHRNLTLRQVSTKGFLSFSHLSDVERGVKEPSSELLESIANGLEVSVVDLMRRACNILDQAAVLEQGGRHKH